MVLPYIKMNLPQVYMCSPSWTLLPPPSPSSSAPAPSIQYHASNLDWWLVSYMILYIFQCHSPKSILHFSQIIIWEVWEPFQNLFLFKKHWHWYCGVSQGAYDHIKQKFLTRGFLDSKKVNIQTPYMDESWILVIDSQHRMLSKQDQSITSVKYFIISFLGSRIFMFLFILSSLVVIWRSSLYYGISVLTPHFAYTQSPISYA